MIKDVLVNFADPLGIKVVITNVTESLLLKNSKKYFGVLFQSPNFNGCIEINKKLNELIKQHESTSILLTDLYSCFLFE